MELVSDVTPALWIKPTLHPFAQDVGSIIPDVYEAYARIFHPAFMHLEDGGLAENDFERYWGPGMWWPDDRAWFVSTEVDFTWTYVGGSVRCIQKILGDPNLESMLTRPTEGNSMQKVRKGGGFVSER